MCIRDRELTKDERLLHEIANSDPMIFKWNVLFYVSLEEFPIDLSLIHISSIPCQMHVKNGSVSGVGI